MGLLLLPLFIVFLVASVWSVAWAARDLARHTRGQPRRALLCAGTVLQAALLAVGVVAATYFSQRNSDVYAFELLLYVMFVPLGVMALGGALLTLTGLERLRGPAIVLRLGVACIVPLLVYGGTPLEQWLNIRTHY